MKKFVLLAVVFGFTSLSSLVFQASASAEEVRVERFSDAIFCFAGADVKSLNSLRIDGATYLAHVLAPEGIHIDLLNQAPGRCISVTVVGYKARFRQADAFKILELTQNQS